MLSNNKPLDNKRWETFAQAKARGMSNRAAYKEAYPTASTKTADNNGSKLWNNAEVRRRCEEIQRTGADQAAEACAEKLIDATKTAQNAADIIESAAIALAQIISGERKDITVDKDSKGNIIRTRETQSTTAVIQAIKLLNDMYGDHTEPIRIELVGGAEDLAD